MMTASELNKPGPATGGSADSCCQVLIINLGLLMCLPDVMDFLKTNKMWIKEKVLNAQNTDKCPYVLSWWKC